MENKKNLVKQIQEKLEEIRPFLNMEGGDISFVKYEDHCVYVKLLGTCAHCVGQDETLKEGVLSLLQEISPEIEDVINVLL